MMDTGPTKHSQEYKLSFNKSFICIVFLLKIPTKNMVDELALSVLASHLSGSCHQILLKKFLSQPCFHMHISISKFVISVCC